MSVSPRGRRGAVVFVLVALNIVMPARYAIGCTDAADERFTWRMFSPRVLVTCTADVRVAGDPVPLTLDPVWLSLIARGRADVAEKAARASCDGRRPVALRMVCQEGHGLRVLRDGSTNLCVERPP